MRLRPVRDARRPDYPSRGTGIGRLAARARRLGCAAAASAALSAAGCYGATAVGDDPDSGPGDAGTLVDSGIGGDADWAPGADAAVDATVDAPPPGRVVELCEPDYRLAGEAMPPSYDFACGEEMPADAPTHAAPSWMLSGELCDVGAAWARMEVAEPYRGQVTFPYDTENTSLTVRAPDGAVAVVIGPDRPCVIFDVEAGTWVLEARPADPAGPSDESFTVAFDVPYEW